MIDNSPPVDREALLARYPRFATELVRFLDDQEQVDRYAAPLRCVAGRPTPLKMGDDGLQQHIPIASALRPEMRFMVGERGGLIVETGPRFEAAARYDLDAEGLLVPQPLDGRPPARLRAFSADKLVFKKTEIRWEDWVDTWERDLAGKGHKPPLMGKVQLLPLGTAKGRLAARRRK